MDNLDAEAVAIIYAIDADNDCIFCFLRKCKLHYNSFRLFPYSFHPFAR